MIANFSVVRNEKRLKIPIKIINFFSFPSKVLRLSFGILKTKEKEARKKGKQEKNKIKIKKGAKKSRMKEKYNQIKVLRWEKNLRED